MFTALVVARAAGESAVTAKRLLSAFVRTPEVATVCERLGVSASALVDDVDRGQDPTFADSLNVVHSELKRLGYQFGSSEHIGSFQPLPLAKETRQFLEERIEAVVGDAPSADGRLTPLHVVAALVGDPGVAAALSRHDLTSAVIIKALRGEL
jgi:hypothetical protein